MVGIVLAVVAGIIVLLVLAAILKAVRIVQQGFVGVITRFGEFKDIKNPGLTFIIPFIEVMKIVDVRETPRTGDRQQVITRDNVAVIVNATIFSQVVDVRLALFTNSDYLVSVDNLARTSVRAVFGSITLDEAFSQRERIGTMLQTQMEEATDKWGVRINRVEVLEITPPEQILQAMALQKQADQEKRARILESEGQQQSAVNVADGQRQAAIKEAEGAQQSDILRAQGRRQAHDPRGRRSRPGHRVGLRGDQGAGTRSDAGGDPATRHLVEVRRESEHQADHPGRERGAAGCRSGDQERDGRRTRHHA